MFLRGGGSGGNIINDPVEEEPTIPRTPVEEEPTTPILETTTPILEVAPNPAIQDAIAGSVTINAQNDITAGNITASAFDPIVAIGGDVTLDSAQQSVSVNSIDTTAETEPSAFENATTASSRGGKIDIDAETQINFSSSLDSSADVLGSTFGIDIDNTRGGDVELTTESSANGLSVAGAAPSGIGENDGGNIITSSSDGDGGNVTLEAPGDIELGFIDASSERGALGFPDGSGGNVSVTTDSRFRATDFFLTDFFSAFPEMMISISTDGGAEDGSIAIDHGGGADGTAFVVGESSVANDSSSNGTVGSLVVDPETNSIPEGRFTTPITEGKITITTRLPNETEVTNPEAFPPTETNEGPAGILTSKLDEQATNEVAEHFGYDENIPIKTLLEIRQELVGIETQTDDDVRPAVIYAFFVDSDIEIEELEREVNSIQETFDDTEERDDGVSAPCIARL